MAGVLAVLTVALTADVLSRGVTNRVDGRMHALIYAHLSYGGALRIPSVVLSVTGMRGVVAVPLILAAILAARRHGSLRPVIVVAILGVGLAVGVYLLKQGVGRTAPTSGSDKLHAGGQSYPSGHAVNAIVGWGLLLEYAASLGGRLERILTVRRRRIATAVIGAAAGFGMLGQDYHWSTDVIAGWLIGAGVLMVVLAMGPIKPAPAQVTPAAAPAPARPSPSA